MTDEITMIKAVLSIVGGMVAQMLGGYDSLLQAVGCAVLLDFALGCLAAMKNKEFSSTVARWGFVSKLIYFAIIAICVMIDSIIGKECFIRNIALVWFLLCEGASLLENSAKLGVPLPKGLVDILVQAKNSFSIRIIDVVKRMVDEYTKNKESEEMEDE